MSLPHFCDFSDSIWIGTWRRKLVGAIFLIQSTILNGNFFEKLWAESSIEKAGVAKLAQKKKKRKGDRKRRS